MKSEIENSIEDAVRAIAFLKRSESVAFIEQASEMLASVLANGNKILIAGNGGSLCDAMHFAEELTGYYRKKRKAFGAIALSDPAHMSCVANDTSFDQVFARGVEAIGQPNDALVVMTTSGNSQNLLNAVEVAKEQGLKTIGFLGKSGGAIKGECDLEWIISGFDYSDRIQEAHMTAIHIIIQMIEQILVYNEDHLLASV